MEWVAFVTGAVLGAITGMVAMGMLYTSKRADKAVADHQLRLRVYDRVRSGENENP